MKQKLEFIRAIDHRGLAKILRHRIEKLLVDNDRDGRDELRQDDAGQRVNEAKLIDQDEVVDGQGGIGTMKLARIIHQKRRRPGKLSCEIAASRCHDDKNRDRRRGDERIDVPNADLRLEQDMDVVLEGEMLRPELDAGRTTSFSRLNVVTSPQ
jgi:hypothetical protein